MKYLKYLESLKSIESICDEYNITYYDVNSDGSIDVDGDVDLNGAMNVKGNIDSRKGMVSFNPDNIPTVIDLGGKGLTELPLKFRKVSGNFYCQYNQLQTLSGCPIEVGNKFNCGYNLLTTLKDCPKQVGSDFICGNNRIKNLEGCPKYIRGTFTCYGGDGKKWEESQLTSLYGGPTDVDEDFFVPFNKLKTLMGSPQKVGGRFNCSFNMLQTLEGAPFEIGSGVFYCYENPISGLYEIFNDYKLLNDSLDWKYLRGSKIIKSRFSKACEELNIEVPDKIRGYNYI